LVILLNRSSSFGDLVVGFGMSSWLAGYRRTSLFQAKQRE